MQNIPNLHLLNEFVHYLKEKGPFSDTFKNYLIDDYEKWCPFTHDTKKINLNCYKTNPKIQQLLIWLNKYTFICKLLDVDRYKTDEIYHIITELKTPENIVHFGKFQELIIRLNEKIEWLEGSISKKINNLTCEECIRLDEAIVCFQNYCFHASIVMSVSAVESRIHAIIKKSDYDIYRNNNFGDFTFGQLIRIFDDKEYKDEKYQKLKTLIPSKHKPLILLLNQYRLLSAHPKEEYVTAQNAESILHLACNFLTDLSLSPYTEEELSCNN